MPIVSRLTGNGTLLVNGTFDENTAITPAKFSTTANTVYAGALDELSLAAGSAQFASANQQCLSAAHPTAFNFAGDFTIECWFYPTNYTSNSYETLITTAYPGDAQGFFFGTYNTYLTFLLGNGSWFYLSTPTGYFYLNTWNHAVLERVGYQYYMFLNGQFVDTVYDATPLTFTQNKIAIGGRLNTQGQIGLMSQVRVINGTGVYTSYPFTPPKLGILPSVPGTVLLLNNLSSATFAQDNSPLQNTVTNNVSVAWNANGPINAVGSTLSQRQLYDGTLQLYTAFDEFTGAPVVDSSLIQWVDAGQTASYPGTGSTLTSLVSAGPNMTGVPAFSTVNGGTIPMVATNAINSSTNFDITGSHTVSVWLNQSVVDATIKRYLTVGTVTENIVLRNDGANSVGQLHYYANIAGTLQQVRVNSQVVANQNANFVGTWDGTTLRLYKNGVNIGSTPASGAVTGTALNHRISSTTESFLGNFYQMQIYNRALSQDEITSNFNALRNRYGI